MKVIDIPVGMLGTNCYLLSSPEKNCVIIDPGAQPDKIANVIREEGLTPKYILLTHGHHDHIGGVKRLMELFPEVKMYIGKGDAEMLTQSDKSHALFRGMDSKDYIFDKTDTMGEGDTFTVDALTIRVLETPGHSLGGLTFLCENLMFSGDTLFLLEVGRTDLYGGSYPVLKQSLKKLCDLEGDYIVYPGHGESTTLEYERKGNPYINER